MNAACQNLPQTNGVANKIQNVAAQTVDAWVPSKELCAGDTALCGDDGVARVVDAYRVGVALRRNAEGSSRVGEGIAVEAEAIGEQQVKGGDAVVLRDCVACITVLDGICSHA